MYSKDNNLKIGKYLCSVICRKYTNTRKFCAAYIELEKKTANSQSTPVIDDIDIQRMMNKMSQIKNGSKSIQIEDLPFFSELLGISCEEILSAGKYKFKSSGRITNYDIACSQSRSVWDEFMQREDDLVLFLDEYGKSVIDYAFEVRNYQFIKYLMEKEYLWFMGKDPENILYLFQNGMNIPSHTNHYNYEIEENKIIQENIQLRKQIIYMAIENKDIVTLEKMQAREMYISYYIARNHQEIEKRYDQYYDSHLIELISSSESKEIIDYFSESFIIDRYLLFFPFINEMVNRMIENNNQYVQNVLNNLLEHNKNILKNRQMKFEEMLYVEKSNWRYDKFDTFTSDRKKMTNKIIRDSCKHLFEWDRCINKQFNIYTINLSNEIYFTSIMQINSSSKDPDTQNVISEINSYYDLILTFKDRIIDMINERLKPVEENEAEESSCSK